MPKEGVYKMSGFRQFRFPFIAMVLLVLTVAFSSCSKKDVITDEPAINPSETAGAAAATDPGADTSNLGNAGDTGTVSAELETVYFPFDSYSLTNEARNALKNNAEW